MGRKAQSSGRHDGFSLLEMIISLGILGALMIAIATSFKGAISSKEKLQNKLDEEYTLRSAMDVIARDIALALNYKDVTEALKAQLREDWQRKHSGVGGAPTGANPGGGGNPGSNTQQQPLPMPAFLNPPPTAAAPQPGFLGEESKIHFITSNFPQVLPDTQFADFAEVGYEVRRCKDAKSNCLWRRVDPELTPQIDQGGKSSVLLSGVKSIKFRYFGREKQDYTSTWNSADNRDMTVFNKFPELVEIILTVEFPPRKPNTKKPVERVARRVVAIQFPNNEPLFTPQQNAGPTPPPNAFAPGGGGGS